MRLLRLASVVVVLGVVCACGGGGGGGGGAGLADLTGTWWLTPSSAGVDDDPVHLTIVQSGAVLRGTATCRQDWPDGTGSWDGVSFSLVFDFGGDVVTLSGAPPARRSRGPTPRRVAAGTSASSGPPSSSTAPTIATRSCRPDSWTSTGPSSRRSGRSRSSARPRGTTTRTPASRAGA